MRLVHGLPFCGMEVEAGSVVYLAGEGQAGMAARFRAWRKHHQHLRLDSGGRYCMVSSEIPPLNKGSLPVLAALLRKVIGHKEGQEPVLVIIDTLSQGLDDDENDAKVVAPVIRGLMALRKLFGVTIVMSHHLVKLQQQGRKKAQAPTRDSIRGSGALTRNIDTVFGLYHPEPDGPRELQVWKQKDGSKLDPIKLWLLPVYTGKQRLAGQDETSCVIVPDPGYPAPGAETRRAVAAEPSPDAPDPKAMELHESLVRKVVATMKALGAVTGEAGKGALTSTEICQNVGGRKIGVLAAIRGAARLGVISNFGTERTAAWVVTPDSGQAQGGSR